MKLILALLTGMIFLSSCAPFKPTDKRAAICNELNSKLIFNGNTSDVRAADIQNSQRDLLWRSYEANHCDDV